MFDDDEDDDIYMISTTKLQIPLKIKVRLTKNILGEFALKAILQLTGVCGYLPTPKESFVSVIPHLHIILFCSLMVKFLFVNRKW